MTIRVGDGNATYLGRDLAELAGFVEEDEDFDFSKVPEADLVALFEVGRWWEKENMPGVARLRRQVMGGEVGYFMHARQDRPMPGLKYACFTPARYDRASLIYHFCHEVDGGIRRAPRELLTKGNVEGGVEILRQQLVYALEYLLYDGNGMRVFALEGWGKSCVVSDGQAHRDWNVLHQRSVRLGAHHTVRVQTFAGSTSDRESSLDQRGHELIELVAHVPGLATSPLRLLPSLAVPTSWSECVVRGRVVSSFLIATPELLTYLDGSPVRSP